MAEDTYDGEAIFQDLVSQMTFTCTALPAPVAERALQKAMRHLSKMVDLLKTKIVLSELESGVATYDFKHELPEGYQVKSVHYVTLCGCKLDVVPECHPCPHGYEMITKTCITLHPCPNDVSPGDVEIGLCLLPGYDLCEFPEELMDWEDELLAGAMGDVLSQPKKDWSDPRAARDKKREFSAAITRVRGLNANDFAKPKKRMRHGYI